MAQDDSAGAFYLIIKKLSEIFHIHFAFFDVNHSGVAIQYEAIRVGGLNRAYYVGELANAGRLYENAFRRIFFYNLFKRFAEVAYKRTAYAAGIHFGDLDAGVF